MFSVFINKIDLLQFILLISQNSIIFMIIILISNVAFVCFVKDGSLFTAAMVGNGNGRCVVGDAALTQDRQDFILGI